MDENTPADTGDRDPNAREGAPQGEPQGGPRAAASRKRRRRWPWVILGIVVVLILLVALLPTLLSTGAGKSFVVSKINNSLNGKLAIADWSIGWTSGVTLNGVKVDDQHGRRVLEIVRIRVPMSLIAAARGNYDLGETVIDKPNLVNLEIYEDGSTNLDKLVKDAGEKTKKPEDKAGDGKIPDVKGKVTINGARATVSGPAVPSPIHLDSGDVVINIPGINSAVTNEGKFVYHVGDSSPGTIALAGTVDAIENNQLNLEQLAADQKLQITSADLAAVEPFLQSPDAKTILGGVVNGALQLKAGANNAGAEGQLTVKDFAYGGDALKGDVYKSANVSIPIHIVASGKGAATNLKIQTFKLETDHVLVDVSGSATQGALENVAARKQPGADGQIAVAVNTKDLPGLVNLLRNTLDLQKDVQVTSGELKTRVELAMTPQRALVKQTLDAVAAGTNAGKPVKLDPVHLDAALAVPDLTEIVVNLTSAFAQIKGGGPSLAALNINGDVDLAKLRNQLGQFTDLGKLQLNGTANLDVKSAGDFTQIGGESELNATLRLNNVVVRGLEGGKEINQPRIVLTANGKLVGGPGTDRKLAGAKTASVTFQSGDAAAPVIDLALNITNLTRDGAMSIEKFDLARLNVDLPRAQQQWAAFMPENMRFTGGAIAATATGSYQNDTIDFTHKSQLKNVSMTDKDARAILTNETGEITAAGKLGKTEATIPSVVVTTSFLEATVTDTLLKLGGETFDVLQRAKITVAAPDLAKVMALVNQVGSSSPQPGTWTSIPVEQTTVKVSSTPVVQPATPTTQPLHIAGAAVATINVSREGNVTHVNVPEIATNKLTLTRGPRTYVFGKNINLKLAADLATEMVTAAPATQPSQQIAQIQVKELTGDLGGVATLSMPEAIVLTNLTSDKPVANGKIGLDGSLEPLTNMLSVLQGADPMPYRGDYAVAQQVRTDAGKIALVGNATVNKLVVLGADGKPAFTEDKVVLDNNLLADTNAKTATINALALSMPTSNAAGLSVKGTVRDWQVQRQLDGVALDLAYDLEKLWPLIRPMLAPETQQSLKDLKIAGQQKRTFNVRGSYPAKDATGRALKFNESIANVSADGALVIALLDTNGAHIENFELPITLDKGILTTVYGNRPRGQRTAKPATFNGGILDLNSILVDLTQETPRLTIARGQVIARDVQINALLSQALGQYFNAFFATANDADGALDITIDHCEKVPLGELVKTDKTGKARMLLSLRSMRIINPVVGQMIKSVARQMESVRELAQLFPALREKLGGELNESNTLIGEIRNGEIVLANGRVSQNITMSLIDDRRRDDVVGSKEPPKPIVMPLKISGDLTLANQLQNLEVVMPGRLIGRALGSSDITRFFEEKFPNGVPLHLGGTPKDFSVKPLVSVTDLLRPWVLGELTKRFGGEKGGQVGDILNKAGDILGGRKPGAGAPGSTTQPSQEENDDPFGSLFEQLTKPKK
jgi:hypothetical protein